MVCSDFMADGMYVSQSLLCLFTDKEVLQNSSCAIAMLAIKILFSNKSLFSLTALIRSVMFINLLLWYFCTSSVLHPPDVGVVVAFFRSL